MNDQFSIKLSKYVHFDDTTGRFILTSDAQEIIYREKEIICSYSGASEWVHNFMCELLDLFSGGSPYNYALGCVEHKTAIPKIWDENPDSVIKFINQSKDSDWGKAMYKTIDIIIDNLPGGE